MESDEMPSRYPYLISVRGGRPVPARKDGHYYVCAYQVFLGLWWSPREVKVLEYDPHHDFYREQRQAKEAAARGRALLLVAFGDHTLAIAIFALAEAGLDTLVVIVTAETT